MLKNETHATTVSLKKKYRYIILYNIHLCFRCAAQKTDAIDCKRFGKIKSISRSEAWKTFSSVVTKHIEKKIPHMHIMLRTPFVVFLCTRGYTRVSDENNKKRKNASGASCPENRLRLQFYSRIVVPFCVDPITTCLLPRASGYIIIIITVNVA